MLLGTSDVAIVVCILSSAFHICSAFLPLQRCDLSIQRNRSQRLHQEPFRTKENLNTMSNTNMADGTEDQGEYTEEEQKMAWNGCMRGPKETLEGMVAAVREAGDAALDLQMAGVSRTTKAGHHDIVTEGDIASQRIAMGGLAKVFPGLSFAAEEGDEEALVPGVPLAWIDSQGSIHAEAYLALDPVDGTTNFACGGPDWGVAAAVVRQDVGPVHGVLYLPRKGIVVEASRGHGCKINGEVVKLREGQRMKDCLVAAEIGAFVPDDRLQRLLTLVHHCMGIRNLFSSTGNTADVLSGVHGAWVHLKGGSVWDFAAGVLAVQEAGGFACDLQGLPLQWDKLKMEVVLAANEGIAREVVRVLGVVK